MQLSDILHTDSVIATLRVANKKQALQELAHTAAGTTGLPAAQVLETLLQRERLGSTGLGHGIAIPHGKFRDLNRLHGVFARLAHPIDFEAVDDQPVDLIFLLLAPESAGADHLKALARISRLLRDPILVTKLRGSESAAALFAVLTAPPASASHAA